MLIDGVNGDFKLYSSKPIQHENDKFHLTNNFISVMDYNRRDN